MSLAFAASQPSVCIAEDRGLGPEAARIRAIYGGAPDRAPSIVLDKSRREALQQLIEAERDAAHSNWDGYGAIAASPHAVRNARLLLSVLPSAIPRPDIAIDPDGEVNFDWSSDRADYTFTMSIGANSISYAGLYGRNRTHGVEEFTNSVPGVVLENLSRLFRESRR